MATRTVTSDVYFDQIPKMTNGDSVEITTGAVLTVRQSNPTMKPAGITVTDGELVFDPSLHPTVPNTPIRFQMYTRDYDIIANAAGKITCKGGWYTLGTGNGTSGQEFTYWINENDVMFPHIQVETGSGTGVYEDWVNIGQAVDLTNVPGDSARGYYFYIPAGTKKIKCGNGSNAGPVFPNGANVRVSNVLLTTDTYYTDLSSTKRSVQLNNGGQCDLTNFSTINNFEFKATLAGNIKIRDCAFGAYFNIVSASTLDIDGVFVMGHRSWTNETVMFRQVYGGGTVKRVKMSGSSHRQISMNNVFNVDFTDLWAASKDLPNGIASAYLTQMNDCTITNLYSATGYIEITHYCSNLTIENIKFTSAFRTGGSPSYGMFKILNVRNLKINNVSLWSADGNQDTYARPHPNGIGDIGNAYPCRITNIDMPYTNAEATQEAIGGNVFQSDIVFARWDLGAFNQPIFRNAYNSNLMSKLKMMNIKTSSSVLLGTNNLFGWSNVQLKSVSAQNVIATGDSQGRGIGGSSDMAFHTLCDANGTSGRLALMANIENLVDYYEKLSGGCYFNNANKLIMRTSGDSARFTCPFPILGVSAISSSAPTLVSSGIALANCYMSVKQEGGEWSQEYNLDTDRDALAALTFDPNVNFYWKLRVTATSSSSSQYFSTIHIPVTLDSSVLYPVSLTTITLDNVVVGSTYYVYKNSDNSLIGSGTAIASTVEITDIPYASDENCTVRVRKPGYVPFETGIIMTEDGSSAWIAQVIDKIYQS